MKLEQLIEREKKRSSNALSLPKPKLHEGQQRILEQAERFNAVSCGRRYGKTFLGKYLAIEILEQGLPVAWSAPEYKYLTEVYNELRRDLEPWIERSNAQERIIELKNGGKIEFWTLTDENVGRSRKYKRWIADEAAMTTELGGIWKSAIRPTLTDLKGDGWLLSTPRGRSGFFYDCLENVMHLRDPRAEPWKAFYGRTVDNKTILDVEEEVEAARHSMAESVFRQEYLGECITKAGAVFDCLDDDNFYDDDLALSGQKAMLGWDFGSANTANVIAYEIDGVLHVEHEYHASGDSAAVHVAKVSHNFEKLRWAVGGSHSEDEYRQQYKDAGMPVRKPPITGRDSYSIGIEIVYGLIKKKKLKIHSRCKMLSTELYSIAYKTDGDDKILDKIEDQNKYHLFDALRYLCVMWGEPPVEFKKLGGRF